MKKSVGILGSGAYPPPQIRTNDHWDGVRANWQKWVENLVPRTEAAVEQPTDGTRRCLAAMALLSDDPFQGVRERRVMPEGMRSSDMEVAAAREALSAVCLQASDVDLLLTHTMVPDFLCVNSASIV